MAINLIEPAQYREGEDDKGSYGGKHKVMAGAKGGTDPVGMNCQPIAIRGREII